MFTTSARHGRVRPLAWIMAMGMAIVASLGFGGAATAADIPGAITNITFSPPVVDNSGTVKMNLSFCVPQGTKSGDTFSATIPDAYQADQMWTTFSLKDADGNVVATAQRVGPNPGYSYVFTMTDYAETHVNTCGAAEVTASMKSSYSDEDVPLESTTNDGTKFTGTVHVNGAPVVDRNGPKKVGSFATSDQCVTDASDCIRWRVQSPSGPFTSSVLTDTLADDQTFDCSVAPEVVIGTPTDTFPFISDTSAYTDGSAVSCSANKAVFKVGSVPAGKIVQVTYQVSATEADPDGAHNYRNDATASTTVNGTTSETSTVAYIKSNSASGNGDGDNITIQKYATAEGFPDGDHDSAPGYEHAKGTEVPVTMKITNTGVINLTKVVVTDTNDAGPALTGLSCDFPDGSTGTTWDGPFAPGASFTCTGVIGASGPGVQETDTAKVAAVGNGPVSAKDPFNSYTPHEPGVSIVKGDVEGNAADTGDDAATLPTGNTDLVFAVKNTGSEPLKDVTVSDVVVSNGTVTGLTCDFSKYGGPTSGTTWAGPLPVGAEFPCTATLSGVKPGSLHEDVATVVGTGTITGKKVTDHNPYFAKTPPPSTTTNNPPPPGSTTPGHPTIDTGAGALGHGSNPWLIGAGALMLLVGAVVGGTTVRRSLV